LGNAEIAHVVRADGIIAAPATKICRNAQPEILKILFSSNNSKLHCLQIGTGSSCAPTDIDPVGASQYPKSELPP